MHPPAFDHEKLDVYRLAIELVAWADVLIDDRVRTPKPSALKHLDEAATSIALNIAEGNGKRSVVDRARFLDIGKASLIRIVSMLTKLIENSCRPRRSEHEYEHEYEYERAN